MRHSLLLNLSTCLLDDLVSVAVGVTHNNNAVGICIYAMALNIKVLHLASELRSGLDFFNARVMATVRIV